ncbi:MAG TPA: HAD-IIB family hydrolase [Burkholderiaceae bacterium]|nr:HAD-IIB family hydrolase [Burkholderiaceae bacterium]
MYFHVLAADFDGTLAHDGAVDDATVQALERFRATGRKLVMVTGRELPALQQCFPRLELFDLVVAENGALLYEPDSRSERPLAPPPPEAFVQRLRERDVAPMSVGCSIVATWEPHQHIVLQAIHDLGLEMQIIFNKGAVMVLPAGCNKASGLRAALAELGLSPLNTAAIGDAENDHAMLAMAGLGVAVSNAVPMLKQRADRVTAGARGAGVVELIDAILQGDGELAPPARHSVALGVTQEGTQVGLPASSGHAVLIAGSSGIGKSTLATALTERMVERGFQFCVFDPEGDYDELEHSVVVGSAKTPASAEEALDLLREPANNVVINTLALGMDERPPFFADLLPQLASLRGVFARPHWLVIDEAHHLLPMTRRTTHVSLPKDLPAAILITVHPEAVSVDLLKLVDTVIALGEGAPKVIESFCASVGIAVPQGLVPPDDNRVLWWSRSSGAPPREVTVAMPRQKHKRHTRKYAEGDLGDESFRFRGPHGKLDLKAQNLALFLQIADGVDDETWEFHRQAGDYSRWFRDVIKDAELAAEAASIEEGDQPDVAAARAAIREAVERRYTAPASTEDR